MKRVLFKIDESKLKKEPRILAMLRVLAPLFP